MSSYLYEWLLNLPDFLLNITVRIKQDNSCTFSAEYFLYNLYVYFVVVVFIFSFNCFFFAKQ